MIKGMDRNLVLSDEVKGSSIGDIIKEIYNINTDDYFKEQEHVGYKREPIKLVILTPGGVCYDGWGLVAAIEQSVTPVHTIALGWAMSMGLPILLAGHKRFAHRFTSIMYHEVAGWGWGKLTSIKEDVKEMQRLQNMYDNYILEKTSVMKEKLDQVKELQRDWFIPADEALKLKIVDEII